MSIIAGNTILASDFIYTSQRDASPSNDQGRVPKLESDAQIDYQFVKKHLKFGGNGSDGALNISSGSTVINCGGAAVFTKNYTSISITGTATVTFINPHAGGTVIRILCQGDCVMTSSNPAFDTRGMGAASLTNPNELLFPTSNMYATDAVGGGGSPGVAGTKPLYPRFYTYESSQLYRNQVILLPGAKGGNGGNGSGTSTPGVGGAGAGALYMEVRGALNFTGSINCSGSNGTNSTNGTNRPASPGGGGSASFPVILVGSITSSSGTIVNKGGDSGARGTGTLATGSGGETSAGAASLFQNGTVDAANSNGAGAGGPGGNTLTSTPANVSTGNMGGLIAVNTYLT